jgi:transcriptional regulator with XRE-family HTH domain
MKPANKRQKQESESALEILRIDRTHLSQDELASRCGIPRATYQRWISGKTPARPTIAQLKRLCRELGIERIDDLPEEFGP